MREAHERATGFATGALGIARAELEADPAATLPDRDAEVLLICQSGGRSLKAAAGARARGLSHAWPRSKAAPTRWSPKGLPMTQPDVDADFYDRYSRHLRLPEVGEAGQRRLEAARVAMVGAGGLGSPAAFYLAAAGVGTLVLADDDVVDRSNLQRQILHTDARIGMPKVESARIALSALNPRVHDRSRSPSASPRPMSSA